VLTLLKIITFINKIIKELTMDYNLKLKEEISKGDFRSEEEDNYIKMLEADSKRNLLLKYSMGAVYLLILIISLFII